MRWPMMSDYIDVQWGVRIGTDGSIRSEEPTIRAPPG
jgi:hypothetical protein